MVARAAARDVSSQGKGGWGWVGVTSGVGLVLWGGRGLVGAEPGLLQYKLTHGAEAHPLAALDCLNYRALELSSLEAEHPPRFKCTDRDPTPAGT